MNKINDGGPAFPHLNPNFDGNWDKEPQRGGMSLRDWFAGQIAAALATGNAGMLGGKFSAYSSGYCNASIADRAYTLADAMLAARQQGDEA